MKSTLRLLEDGWELKDADGTVLDTGGYPLREDSEFIESAAKKLDNWQYHKLPYERVDERDDGTS